MSKNLNYWLLQQRKFLEMRSKQLQDLIDKMTPIESIALLSLLDLTEVFGMHNFTVTPQKKIGKYRVDFHVIYAPIDNAKIIKNIIIECDGHEWHERTKEQAARDKERDRFFVKEGFTVFRYSGSELVNDRFKLYSDIEEILLPERLKESFGYPKMKLDR